MGIEDRDSAGDTHRGRKQRHVGSLYHGTLSHDEVHDQPLLPHSQTSLCARLWFLVQVSNIRG
jgi:hypothetical protein